MKFKTKKCIKCGKPLKIKNTNMCKNCFDKDKLIKRKFSKIEEIWWYEKGESHVKNFDNG